MPKGPTPGFPCVYGLNKPKPMKKYIGGTSRGKSRGVDPLEPTDRRFRGGGGREGPPEHLHVDLGYV